MSRAAIIQLRKEFRALSPVWALGTLAVVGTTVVDTFRAEPAATIGLYAVVAVALGALSMGQEFSWRTADALLAQPTSRATLAGRKLIVLASLLVLLGAISLAAVSLESSLPGRTIHGRIDVWLLPLLGSLCVAPWLTMQSRSTVAGLMFTIGLGFALWLSGGVLTRLIFGVNLPSAERDAAAAFQYYFYEISALAACVVGAFLGWRSFVTLDTREHSIVTTPLASWWPAPRAVSPTRSRSRVRQSPLMALWRKELRLQQPTFVVAAGFCLVTILIAVTTADATTEALLSAFSLLYIGCVAVLAGSLASAEERHAGTIDTQGLLPVGRRTQWAMKVATALSAGILTVGLGLSLATRLAPSLLLIGRLGDVIAMSLLFLLAFVAAVYASSASESSVRAMILAVALCVGVPVLWLQVIAFGIREVLRGTWWTKLLVAAFGRPPLHGSFLAYQTLAMASMALMAMMILWFAYQNHWSALPTNSRLLRQVSILTLMMIGLSVVIFSLP